ncbi:MAG: hypothetical protein KAW88_03420, partial [Candidatus Cloacimonetes bacterium]|nr:hypothetical protein [Candidatus Cloacimonadota bacterium]
MKRLLIFPFFIFALLLQAEKPEQNQLDLGDILIIGETSALSDTVSGERDLAQYWYVSEPQQFEFKAFFSFPEIQLPKPFALRDNLAIQIIGGNYYFCDFRGVYSSGNYLRFTTDFYCEKIEEDWKDTKYSFTWQPAFNNHNFNLQLLQDKYESESGDTKIEGINLKYDNNFISIRNFNSLTFDLGVKLCYNEFSQLVESAMDFDFLSYTKLKYENYLGEIDFNLLKQSLSGDISAKVTNLSFFDEIGFWFGVDKEHIYPSIEFSTEFNPFPKLYLLLENKPQIGKVSRKDAFQQNNYQRIIMDKLQTKKPLNGSVALKYNCFIPFTLLYNISWNQDFKNYYSTGSFYEQTNVDFILQKFGLRAC